MGPLGGWTPVVLCTLRASPHPPCATFCLEWEWSLQTHSLASVQGLAGDGRAERRNSRGSAPLPLLRQLLQQEQLCGFGSS